MKKRIASLLLALTLCLTLCLPVGAAGAAVTGAYANGVVTVTGTGFPASTTYSMIAVKVGDNLIALGSATAGASGALSTKITTGAIAVTPDCKVYVYNNVGGTVAAFGAVTAVPIVTYTITVTAGAGGTITPGTVNISKGGSKTFTITANSGYSIASVTVDGTAKGAIGTFTFNDVQANHTIAATFSYNGGSGSGDSSGGGTGSGSSSSTVSGSGSSVAVSAGTNGAVSASTLTSAVGKATAGSTITIGAGNSGTASLPVSGMKTAAENNNGIALTLKNGAVALSAGAIGGLVDGASANATVGVAIQPQTSSTDSAVSALIRAGAKVFDVSVSVGNTAVHNFDGSLSITLTVSGLGSMKAPMVLHVLSNGQQEALTPTVSGNRLTINGVRALSSFAVMEAADMPEIKPAMTFYDVASGAYYYDAVVWAVQNGITGGTSATTFSPNAGCTRAQVVTLLWRASGSPAMTSGSQFTDVSGDAYYADAVAWAVKQGITSGTTATTFAPDTVCTRAQVVTFLHRAAGAPAASGSGFSDVASDAYYASAVAWAVEQNVTSGTTATTFAPYTTCSRAQIVTFLYRALAD